MGGRCRLVAILFVAATLRYPLAANGDGAGVAPAGCAATVWIPANITIDDDHVFAVTNDMAGRSPTFRNRLLQIGAVQTVRARIRSNRLRISNIALTQTVFAVSVPGWLFADIQIPPTVLSRRDNVRMIAHEIEHVIEQMEGLDLRALARKRRAGVHRLGKETVEIFETDRATAFGLTVEREFLGQTAGSVCPREPHP